ncbi:MAG: MBL fold metallo-hydrolase [Desulfobacteraceae bacterium]|nr:MBL fold metallo-hydrolase [Desulfobacteraceae bacterium]
MNTKKNRSSIWYILFRQSPNMLNSSVLQLAFDLIICTNACPDHIKAVCFLDDTLVLFTLHQDEWKLIKGMESNLRSLTSVDIKYYKPDLHLIEGQLNAGQILLEIHHTPEHWPGAVTAYWP